MTEPHTHPCCQTWPGDEKVAEALKWAEEWNLGNSRQERKIKVLAAAYRAKSAELEEAQRALADKTAECEGLKVEREQYIPRIDQAQAAEFCWKKRAQELEANLAGRTIIGRCGNCDIAEKSRLNTEKDLVRAWTLVDTLRDALSALRVRILEVYAGPSPMLDEVWEQSRKALAKETYEHHD